MPTIRFPLLWIVLVCAPAQAALEEWTCIGLADYYGYVAVDRDRGMSVKDRVNATIKAIIVVSDSDSAYLNIEADDAQGLIQIVHYVYQAGGSARDIRLNALRRCLQGNPLPPEIKKTGANSA